MSTINLFNAAWYLHRNPDVAAAVAAGKITAEGHFKQFGMAEGRAPGPLFDQAFYLHSNPDIKAAVDAGLTTAYAHFLNFGVVENRSPLIVFDSAFYLSQNADVAQAVQTGQTSAVAHFLAHGQNEPRSITPFINLQLYLNANADVQSAVEAGTTTPFTHLAGFGLYEGRDLGNGLNLSLFRNDSLFRAALTTGDADAALARLSAVAPFLPGFVRPAGWKPDPDTAIPLDFKPADGSQLHVPGDITIPDGQTLPDWFDNTTPAPAPEPGPGPGPTPSFSVKTTLDDDTNTTTYTFEGTAVGDITGTLLGTPGADDYSIEFTRGGVKADDKVPLVGWTPGETFINLAADQKLVLESADVNSLSTVAEKAGSPADQYAAVTGNGAVHVTGSVQHDQYFVVTSDYSLVGIDSSVLLTFDHGVSQMLLGNEGFLQINARHADGLNIVRAAGNPDGNVHVRLSDVPDGDDGVTIKVGTGGSDNVIGGTTQNDTIQVSPGNGLDPLGTYHILPGKGADTVILDNGFMFAVSNVVEVRTGKDGGVSDSYHYFDDYGFFDITAHDTIHNFHAGFNSKLKLDAGVSVLIDVSGASGQNGVSFDISYGIATFSNIGDGGSDAKNIDARVDILAAHMGATKGVVGFIYKEETYILQGDGNSGLTHSDVFIKLAGAQVGNMNEVFI